MAHSLPSLLPGQSGPAQRCVLRRCWHLAMFKPWTDLLTPHAGLPTLYSGSSGCGSRGSSSGSARQHQLRLLSKPALHSLSGSGVSRRTTRATVELACSSKRLSQMAALVQLVICGGEQMRGYLEAECVRVPAEPRQ